jgi:Transposase DNA-binding
MTKWAEEELGTLSLGDARLDKRAVVVAEQLAQRPGASIPQSGAAGERPGINEGVRWVESYAHLVGLASQLATTRLVCVGDRESDTMALFEQAQRSGWAVDVLVRAQHDRVLPDQHAGKLWSRVMATPALGCVRFEVPGGRGRKARTVRQELRAQRVVLKEGCRVERLQLTHIDRLETAVAL